MTPKRFLEQFGYLTEAPNGITKLRELILQLAVRGKLVAQDANDEPASVLLERIREEKERLVADEKVKKTKQLPTVGTADVPFPLPIGWEWARLGSITSKIGSGSTPRGGKNAYVDSGIAFLRSQNIWNDGLRLEDVAFITEETHEKMANTCVFDTDILLNITGASLGRCALVPTAFGPANVSQHVTIIRPVLDGIRSYLHKCLLSPFVQRMVWGRQVGMAREGLSKRVLEQFEIPIPPPAEQSRIVAKVDQLMALCDELEAKQNQCAETHVQLIRAVHHPLTQPRDHAELQAAWRRIRDNFDGLHTTVDSVKVLRQTILQLAVQGKLVPQDPNDEPASVLLERIREEKERLVAEGKIKGTKALPPIKLEEVPFEVPEGWSWVSLGEFGSWKGGGTPSKQNSAYWSGDIPWVSPKDMKRDLIDDSQDHVSELALEHSTLKEIQLGSLLMVVRGMILAHSFPVSISRRVVTINQDMKALELFQNSFAPFLQLSLKAEKSRVLSGVERSSHGTCRLSSENLNSFVIATPPIREQVRIVQRVSQLMALCDKLEEKIEANQTTARQFAEAIVAKLAA